MNTNFEDLRQSGKWAKYLSHLGWHIEKPFFIRKLPLIGSIIKIQRPLVIPPIEKIDETAEKHRALFVKLEPSFAEAPKVLRSFTPDGWPLLPSKTIWIDLTPSEEEILTNFSKDSRYSIRRAERNEVEIRSLELEVGNLETFYNLLRETGKRKKFWVPPEADLQAKAQAFKGKSTLILAYHQSELIAGALILFHDQVAYYHHAASNLKGRKLLAPYLIVWEAIRLAKKQGCHTFDLEGIYDHRYKIYKRWKNISIFKRKFGGKETEYPGSYIRFYNPVAKMLFKFGDRLTQLGI